MPHWPTCHHCGARATHVHYTGLDGDTALVGGAKPLDEIPLCLECSEEYPDPEELPSLPTRDDIEWEDDREWDDPSRGGYDPLAND